MIGGYALQKLGSSRKEKTLRYLVSEPDHEDLYLYQSEDVLWINAPRHPFYNTIWEHEQELAAISPLASSQSLFEIAVFMWSNNRRNGFWERQITDELDIKFLARKFNINSFPVAREYLSEDEIGQVKQMITRPSRLRPNQM